MAETKIWELGDIDKAGFTKNVKVLICYELEPTVDRDELVSAATEGIKHATQLFPFLTGSFKFQESGKLTIETSADSQVEVKVRKFGSSEHESISSLAQKSFSEGLDHENMFPSELLKNNAVCAIQLSLVEGGLILGFQVNHAVADWTSLNTFMSLVCESVKAHREGLELPSYTPDLDRTAYNASEADPPMSRQELLESLPIFKVVEKSEFKPPLPQPPTHTKLYRTTDQVTKQLKERCAPFLQSIGVEYVSSYDCIAALSWRAVTRARLQLEPRIIPESTHFLHPIDLRTRDPENKTSAKYFGNGVIGCQAGPIGVQELIADGDKEFAHAASLIRKSIPTVSLASVKHMIALMNSLSASEMLNTTADFNYNDLFMNSWYSGKAAQYDLGNGTTPVAFRKDPQIAASSVVILPDFSKGGARTFDVLVQLTTEEHAFLEEDEEFMRSFEFIA